MLNKIASKYIVKKQALQKVASAYLEKRAYDESDLFHPANLMQSFMGKETEWDAADPYNDKYWIRTKLRWNPDENIPTGKFDKQGRPIMHPKRESSVAFGPGQATEAFAYTVADHSPAMRAFINRVGGAGYRSSRIHGRSLKQSRDNYTPEGFDINFDYGGNWGGLSKDDKRLYLQGMYDAYGAMAEKFPAHKYTSDKDRLAAMAKYYYPKADQAYIDAVWSKLNDPSRARYVPEDFEIADLGEYYVSDSKRLADFKHKVHPYTGYRYVGGGAQPIVGTNRRPVKTPKPVVPNTNTPKPVVQNANTPNPNVRPSNAVNNTPGTFEDYTVVKNDTLSDLAHKRGFRKADAARWVDEVVKLNNLPNANTIGVGKKLRLPLR